jgi:hypothetical protein
LHAAAESESKDKSTGLLMERAYRVTAAGAKPRKLRPVAGSAPNSR